MAAAENLESLKKQYGEAIVRRMERRKQLQKIIMFVGVFAFMGMMSSGFGKIFKDALQSPQSNAVEETSSIAEQLQSRERGYELVLQREPENQTALEGLARVRLEQNKLEEAIVPLEQLVELYPDRKDYRGLLKRVKSDLKSIGEK